MKTSRNVSAFLLASMLLITLGSCKFTVTHKYEEGFNAEGANQVNNMISTQDLGVGYDLVHTDPEDWGANSVQGAGVRPKVFVFEPDPNPSQTIDIPQLEGKATRRKLPKGVFAETNASFKWAEELRMVSSASDFREDYSNSVSVEGGMPMASFSASASFGNVQESTAKDQKTYVYKDGAFRGHVMALDPTFTHQLTTHFRQAVKALDALDSAHFAKFVHEWGTHYTGRVTIGARCAYRMEFSLEKRSRLEESSLGFEATVKGGTAGVQVGVGAAHDQNTSSSLQTATEAEDVSFVSYGGSGSGIDDFATWTNHAVNNPALVDVYLESYEKLMNTAYFPNDPLIDQKRAQFKLFVDSTHYENNTPTVPDRSVLPEPDDATFVVKVISMKLSMTKRDHGGMYGELAVVPFDGKGNYLPVPGVNFTKTFLTYFWQIPEGSTYWEADNGAERSFNHTKTFTVPWEYLDKGFISLVGTISEYWAKDSPRKTMSDKDNRIAFASVAKGATSAPVAVKFVMGDPLGESITATVEMTLERKANPL